MSTPTRRLSAMAEIGYCLVPLLAARAALSVFFINIDGHFGPRRRYRDGATHWLGRRSSTSPHSLRAVLIAVRAHVDHDQPA
ncbi:MAG: hypothetical protein R3B89_28545 [Polyangiaceae bacterium]